MARWRGAMGESFVGEVATSVRRERSAHARLGHDAHRFPIVFPFLHGDATGTRLEATCRWNARSLYPPDLSHRGRRPIGLILLPTRDRDCAAHGRSDSFRADQLKPPSERPQ